jgi:hypothetical protein
LLVAHRFFEMLHRSGVLAFKGPQLSGMKMKELALPESQFLVQFEVLLK